MSESVFAGLCRKEGTSMQVNIRRQIMDITQILFNEIMSVNLEQVIYSGSYREGFRLEGSDVDTMYWSLKNQVVWDLDQARYITDKKCLLLCECSESPPGFTLLKLMTPMQGRVMPQACVIMNDKLYISSSKFRRLMCSGFLPNCYEHGPCASGSHRNIDYDVAFCFQCNFWPPSGSSWVDRCHSWPQPQVVHDIVRNGCHFVPIGHKLGNHEDHEWRISFSQAEQKLMYSMNHCQFLSYGLLKIFLKEIINSGLDSQDKLLCSYHMKTAVFWALQQNTIPFWCPQNLLKCLWVCFKLLLKWVYEGVCPNFFIPENNMFLSKIHGEVQKILFLRLYELYEKGLACLLYSPSIRPYVIIVLHNPSLSLYTDEYNLNTETELDWELFKEIYNAGSFLFWDLDSCIRNLHTVEHLIGSYLTQYQVVLLQKHTAQLLQTTATLLFNRRTITCANKLMYTNDKMVCHMLTLAAKFGCISDMLYIAMYYYQTSRHMKSLSFIEMTKTKLIQPYLMYNDHVYPAKYIEAVGRQSFSTKRRRATAVDIKLYTNLCYITELVPEQSGIQIGSFCLLIPSFILLYMLEILCSIHIDRLRAERALENLQALVHFDEGCMYLKE
ncbi:uncharacterized protein LOC133173380 [Saccostrea echinata]|uniref:uncharacterized protein LOC133173380 n=1 Tax=Saccostrea echinata TaxID=191078 RepID=UPI002A83027B|nr:uncharacterized protein LOC133173380 [Saccostrea echinata]